MNIFVRFFLIPFYKVTPLKVLYFTSSLLFWIVYYLIGYRKKVVYHNLKNSFPEKNHKEIIRIQKKFFKYFIDIFFVEIFKFFTLDKHQLDKIVQYKNPEEVHKHLRQNKNIMILLGHYGNWEVGMTMPKILDVDISAVYNPLTNEAIDAFIKNKRERFGIMTFQMKETFRYMKSKQHIQNVFIFLADQSPHRDSIKHYIHFLNQDTPVFIGPEKLSKLYDQIVIYAEITRFKRGKYELTFKTICERPKETKELEITKKYFALLEESIKKQPEYWLWSHKRWKHVGN